MKKILRFLKNILFPKIYMPWEDPINGSNLSHDERVEMIALIDNILADRLTIASHSKQFWTRRNKNE